MVTTGPPMLWSDRIYNVVWRHDTSTEKRQERAGRGAVPVAVMVTCRQPGSCRQRQVRITTRRLRLVAPCRNMSSSNLTPRLGTYRSRARTVGSSRAVVDGDDRGGLDRQATLSRDRFSISLGFAPVSATW